ncbi:MULTISPECIES: Cof-type HAD-IIB family hydrolase [unclassified Neisseria]|uniref:Cof-type HAD-IIB family hydrolase n=1 Tax=unclassified Neisseria TaxID=2623750 RepID=UPI0010723E15|nr:MULTISPECIES: Cof-type HAD-IIB family hydrolase [unclassified Neisseria]MBF0803585.1 Cof-type HAD-IIB family hydrolase [Neisseria sp. 19428wB4_WF04]TFU43764.1 Cof-type HAD-IIB family hydrolase [Neisseria sp. WF04]
MKTPKIIFFDIDDTLYRKYTDTLRPSVAEAVKALKARGILTAIATGRPYAAMPAKVRALAAEAGMDLLLTINGQFVRYRGEVLQKYPLETAKVEALCAYFDRKGIAYAFVADHTIAVSEPVPEVEGAMAHILPDHPVDKDFYRRNEVFQMLGFYAAGREAEMAAAAAEHGCRTVRWHESAVDILDIEGSKARGIRAAAAGLGIDMQEVMAFGDGLNDIEMIKAVGFGVAMGNGHPDLKAAADYICPTVEEDGVYSGLKSLGII